MQGFIVEAEQSLSQSERARLVAHLEATQFSSVKHEILMSGEDTLVKALLIGLLFGQIDVYVAQEPSVMEGYLSQFDQVCDNLSVPKMFAKPITISIDDICQYFG